jgi:hypothetical protein
MTERKNPGLSEVEQEALRQERMRKVARLRKLGLNPRVEGMILKAGKPWLDPEYLDESSDGQILKLAGIEPLDLGEIRRALEQFEWEEVLVGLAGVFRPFAGREALTPDKNFLQKRFTLPNVGKGTIAFVEACDSSDIRHFVSFYKNRRAKVVAPYNPGFLGSLILADLVFIEVDFCEVNVYLDLPLRGKPPFCLLELPSAQQECKRFVGFPSGYDDDGEILIYDWRDVEGQESKILLPNKEKVIQEIMIGLF